MLRSNQLHTFGPVTAKNAHFKADWWWLNRAKVDIENEMNIDATVSLEVYPGYTRTKSRTKNAICNFNLLGLIKLANKELRPSDTSVYIIFLLAVAAGLRRKEIDLLEWSTFR